MQFATEEKDRTLDELIKSWGLLGTKKNETVERHMSFTRNKESGEAFNKYLTELKLLEKTVILVPLPNLSLRQCIDIYRASELSKERN